MVLPATVLLAAAALRLLQPRQHEPARTAWILFDWTVTHIHTPLGAALLFLGMPGVAAILGCATLRRTWRENQALRQDTTAGLAILRRHLLVGLLATATLLAGAILTLAVAHVITD